LFFDQLDIGHRYVLIVGSRLLAAGLTVRAPPSERRQRVEDRHQWQQDVDLYVGRADPALPGTPLAIEVKSRGLQFTGPTDFPYPTVFVDTVSGWDARRPPPSAVVIVSQQTGAMIVVRGARRGAWRKILTFDRQRRIHDTWYAAPRHTLQAFEEFLDELVGFLGYTRL